jgi:hypothetical protein
MELPPSQVWAQIRKGPKGLEISAQSIVKRGRRCTWIFVKRWPQELVLWERRQSPAPQFCRVCTTMHNVYERFTALHCPSLPSLGSIFRGGACQSFVTELEGDCSVPGTDGLRRWSCWVMTGMQRMSMPWRTVASMSSPSLLLKRLSSSFKWYVQWYATRLSVLSPFLGAVSKKDIMHHYASIQAHPSSSISCPLQRPWPSPQR